MQKSAYLLYLVGLQEITGFSEVGFERFNLQLRFDGRAMLGIHLFFGGDLRVQKMYQTSILTGKKEKGNAQKALKLGGFRNTYSFNLQFYFKQLLCQRPRTAQTETDYTSTE